MVRPRATLETGMEPYLSAMPIHALVGLLEDHRVGANKRSMGRPEKQSVASPSHPVIRWDHHLSNRRLLHSIAMSVAWTVD